jgi:hypothetical protein
LGSHQRQQDLPGAGEQIWRHGIGHRLLGLHACPQFGTRT